MLDDVGVDVELEETEDGVLMNQVIVEHLMILEVVLRDALKRWEDQLADRRDRDAIESEQVLLHEKQSFIHTLACQIC